MYRSAVFWNQYINGFLGIFLFLQCSLAYANSLEITVVTEHLPPLQIKNGQHAPTGAMVELVEAILKDAELESDINLYPWARAFQLAKTKPNTIIFSIMRNESRESDFIWIGELYDTKVYFVKLAERKDLILATAEDALSSKVGVVQLDISQEYLLSKGFKLNKNIYTSAGYERLWDLLYTEKIDYLLANKFMWLNKEALPGSKFPKVEAALELTDFADSYYLAANKHTSKSIIKRLTKSLEKIKKNGQYQAIIEKWQLN